MEEAEGLWPSAISPSSPFQKIMFQKIDYPFLVAAFLSFLVSVGLWFLANHEYGAYVGLWVPSILIFWVGVRLVILARQTNTCLKK